MYKKKYDKTSSRRVEAQENKVARKLQTKKSTQ